MSTMWCFICCGIGIAAIIAYWWGRHVEAGEWEFRSHQRDQARRDRRARELAEEAIHGHR